MLRRTKRMASKKIWVGYYYNSRDEQGKRIEISLGTDLNEAKRKWAELECATIPENVDIMKLVFDRYEREIVPTKAHRTQKDNLLSIKQLRSVFSTAPINFVTPQHIAQYRDARSEKAPIRANREITLFSHIWNMAREWGYTAKENPCRGVRKNKETPRDFYADSKVWAAVHHHAVDELKDAMDLAYLTGQRPSDILKMKSTDIRNGALEVKQNKTNKFLRILLNADGKPSELSQVIDRCMARQHTRKTLFLVATPAGQPLNRWTLRERFDTARSKAAAQAELTEDLSLSKKIRCFQFRDIRSKAASEIDHLSDASKLLGHTEQQITEKVYRRVGEAVKPTR